MERHNTDETVVLEVFNDQAEAQAARAKLEDNGITNVVVDENVVGLNPLGGIELKIFAKDAERAKRILAS
ncbi:MAG TPA: DUF2007 domain-containing protein [Chitinophagaceae bacterium]